MWRDSATVIQWTRNKDKKQSVFVANREAQVSDSTTVDQRNHIDGVKNPAKLRIRGISYPKVIESDWLQGVLWRKDENWISNLDQKMPNEQQELDDHFEVAIDSETQVFLVALGSKPVEY